MDSGTGNSGRSSSDGNEGSCDSRAAADSLFIPDPAPPLPTYNNPLRYHNSINPDTPLPVTTQNTTTTAENTMMIPQQPSLQPPPPPSTAARNPKKRSRVSRRAPTTVLTTDTTNFRSMVQEFTGIPSTPFCNNSSNMSAVTPSLSARTRLDLFRSTALIPSRATSAYLSHPFPQKNQPGTVTDTDLLVVNHTVDDSRINSSCNISFPFGTDNYQRPISSQALGLHNVATNPLLSSLLQRTTSSTDDMHHHGSDHVFRMMNGSDHDLITLGHGETFSYDQTLLGLPSLVSTDQVASLRNNGGHNISTDPDHGDHDDDEADDHHLIGPMKMAKHDNCDSTNCSVGEKGLEDVVATRSEGMFESWIRSSE